MTKPRSPARVAEWRARNSEYQKQWRATHPSYHKEWRATHPNYQQQWRAEHPNCDKQPRNKYTKKWRTFVGDVKTRMQCQNPLCPVKGPLPPYCLDFHHVRDKHFNISNRIHSLSTVITEMRKCTVLCAVCHRAETHSDLDASAFPRCDEKSFGRSIHISDRKSSGHEVKLLSGLHQRE